MKFDTSVDNTVAEKLTHALAEQSTNLGIVEAATEACRDGNQGFLVWHYVFHNEVSFVSSSGQITSLYTSIADEYAITEFDRLKVELNS